MGAARDLGAALYAHLPSWSDAVAAGRQDLAQGVNKVAGGVPVASIVPAVHDFISGLATGTPTLDNVGDVRTGSVSLALPPARMAAPKVAAAAPAPAKVAAATPKVAAAADPLAGLGKLSFRQLLTLGEVADKTTPRGTAPRPPSSADVAGQQLASIYQNQFANSISAAGKDPAKQQAAIDAFEKKMLPLALKGNTANEYIYGQTPGGQ